MNKHIPQVQIQLQDIPSIVGVNAIQLPISVLDKTEPLVNNNILVDKMGLGKTVQTITPIDSS